VLLVRHGVLIPCRDVRNGFFKFGSVLRKTAGLVLVSGSVLKNRRFGFLCGLVVKYKKRVSWRAQLLSQYCTVLR